MKYLRWTFQAACVLAVLCSCASPPTSASPVAPARLGTNQDQAMIQALQKRLQERERTIARQNYQIEVMASQLEALKQIDQDAKVQRLPARNSVTLTP